MRRWIVLALIFLVAAFGSLYLFIPNQLTVKQSQPVFFPAKAFTRALLNKNTWQQWWPVADKNSNSLTYNHNTYTIAEQKISSLIINISNGEDSLQTELFPIPIDVDSLHLEWMGTASSSINPVARYQKNRWVKQVSADLNFLLQKMKVFYTNPDHFYALPVREERVKDSILVSTSTTATGYPSPALIYNLVEKLRAHALKYGAGQSGLPMLNVSPANGGNYQVKVALPVNKRVPNKGDIQYRWMLGGGNILVTEVKGGPHQVRKAFLVLEEYINDFKRVAPAIPFESLVTNRKDQPDTSQWVTKVYWPVM